MTIELEDWPQLMTLLERALALPAGERESWLAGVELASPIRSALLELLEDRKAIESGDFLGSLPQMELPPPMPAERLEQGAFVGVWRLLQEIGHGGMSTVWLAERGDGQVKRHVALKLPHAGPRQHLLAMRLLRERDILAALEHPNVARLYDVGVTEIGMPYLVMEFVAGSDILAHAQARGLSLSQRIELFQQVLSAVQYAHSRLVLHRDLKPANILVDSAGQAKLLDFGIAKALADDGSARDATELTSAVGRQLTPAYASPEQLQGHALSTASDVYSLGVVLHELLTGERPCGVSDSTSAAGVEHAILNVEPRPPSRCELSDLAASARGTNVRSLRAQLAGDLDAIVLKALAKTPGRRYASPGDLAADLARWQSGEPVSVRTPGVFYYAGKFVGRHRLGTSLGALALLAIFAASGIAVARELEARRDAAKAIASLQFMQDLFQDSDADLNAGHAPTGLELLAQGRAKLLKAAETDTALPVDDLLASIARAQFEQGDPAAAEATLALMLARPTPDSKQRLSAWLLRSEIAMYTGQIADARADLAHAETEARLLGPDARTQRRLAYRAGQIALHDGRPEDARIAFDRYLRMASNAPDEPAEDMVAARLASAKIESVAGHRDAARTLLAEAFAQAAKHPELDKYRFGEVTLYRANIEVDAGQYATVASWLPGTAADCNRTLGPQSAVCHSLDAQLVRVLLKRGDARQATEVAMTLQTQLTDTRSPPQQVEAAVLIARSLAWAAQDAPLGEVVDQLTSLASAANVTPSQRLLALNTLAEVQLLRGNPDDALAWVAKAHELAATKHLAGSREAVKTNLFEGAAQQAKSRPELALRAFGAQCDEASLSTSRLPVLDRLLSLNCARPLADTGRADVALALVSSALPVLREGLGPQAPMVLRAEGLLQELRSPVAPSSPRKFDLFS